MSAPVPTSKGWYPDEETNGTKYWDGSRWTGDTRPPRKPFAAACSMGTLGYLLVLLAVSWTVLGVMAFDDTGNAGYIVGGIVFLLLSIPACAYLQRGQGPSTAEVEARLARERKEAKARRRAANVAGVVANFGRPRRPSPTSGPANSEAAAVAQVNAIAAPETARALQNLQNLLYTHAITEAEYQGAKDKLLGTQALNDSFAQIAKLAELHEAGILGDVEFSAAKARVLGL